MIAYTDPTHVFVGRSDYYGNRSPLFGVRMTLLHKHNQTKSELDGLALIHVVECYNEAIPISERWEAYTASGALSPSASAAADDLREWFDPSDYSDLPDDLPSNALVVEVNTDDLTPIETSAPALWTPATLTDCNYNPRGDGDPCAHCWEPVWYCTDEEQWFHFDPSHSCFLSNGKAPQNGAA